MIKAIITDIEGTTTPLSFVKDGLFPYAYQHLPHYVTENQDNPAVIAILNEARELLNNKELSVDDLITEFLQWIKEDKKITPLKTLQGFIWEAGYKKGEIEGLVYLDAIEQLKLWHQQGCILAIFSSGSVLAQKLLFAHTAAGDLTPLFSGFFDTTTGAKNTKEAYEKIARTLHISPENILFLSDAPAELDAAREAEMKVIGLIREDAIHSINNHPVVNTFKEIKI